ncbi:MAG: DNA primase [Betaproteobacteria bacterium]|nr:MAG: DNA primase [Betaproteobacteria bacterium]
MIPQSFIQGLLNRVDIVDVIERHMPLKKSGTNYIACCPFHSEKTPSFTVSPTKQFYHCFGCGAHGSAVGFMMEYVGMDFVEAVNDLASRVGMQVPVQKKDIRHGMPDFKGCRQNKENSSQDLFEVMNIVTRFYREQLKRSERGIAYLKERGLTGETAARFAIGYAPAGQQNLAEIFPDYHSRILLEVGVVSESGESKRYDRFRDRIMFPILNQKGRIAGFGGRVLGQNEPKYLNSPETPLFEKGRELYNLFTARRAIRDAERVIVVEGYMDVVVLSQHGIEYVVATLGTATTPHHVQKLLRQTDNVLFCFDGDNAGRKAAWRALENSLAQFVDGKNIGFVFLPEGEDPDSYVRKFGKDAFEGLINQALPLSVFLFKGLSEGINLQTSEGRAKLVQDAKPLLAKVVAPILALMLLKRLAELSGISQDELEGLLQIRRVSSFLPRGRILRPNPISPCRWLIQVLLHDPGYILRLDRKLLSEHGESTEEMAALVALVEFIDTHPHVMENTAIPSAITYFYNSPHRSLLEKAQSATLSWDNAIDLEAEFNGALARLREMQRKQRMTELQNKSLSALTSDEKQELQRLSVFLG